MAQDETIRYAISAAPGRRPSAGAGTTAAQTRRLPAARRRPGVAYNRGVIALITIGVISIVTLEITSQVTLAEASLSLTILALAGLTADRLIRPRRG
jgi:hypothetical protein